MGTEERGKRREPTKMRQSSRHRVTSVGRSRPANPIPVHPNSNSGLACTVYRYPIFRVVRCPSSFVGPTIVQLFVVCTEVKRTREYIVVS